MTEKYLDQLKKIIEVCAVHRRRMKEAYSRISSLFPLNEDRYTNCSSEMVAFVDQYIFRFAKLQSVVGEKLFKSLLINSGEDLSGLTFLDILSMIEKFRIIESSDDWLKIRDVRNNVSHDYPMLIQETVDALNVLVSVQPALESVVDRALDFIKEKNLLSSESHPR